MELQSSPISKSESIKELAKSLLKFQSLVETIRPDSKNPFFKSKYASLSTIIKNIREPMNEAGLVLVQCPVGHNSLTTILMDSKSGEWIEATYSMKPVKADPQGIGSVITYMRRYALSAFLGLNTDEDDDGNSSSLVSQKKNKKSETKAPISENAFAQVLNRVRSGEKELVDKVQNIYLLTPAQQDLLKAA